MCGATGERSCRIAERDRRDERDARVQGLKFEVFGTSNPELRTADRVGLALLPSLLFIGREGERRTVMNNAGCVTFPFI
jgi:hypothetical protein